MLGGTGDDVPQWGEVCFLHHAHYDPQDDHGLGVPLLAQELLVAHGSAVLLGLVPCPLVIYQLLDDAHYLQVGSHGVMAQAGVCEPW